MDTNSITKLHEGDRINNYLLEERVGRGSFGEVWRARHHVFGEHVAIKIPTNREYVRNLQRGGVVIHGLRHPNIVRALDMDPHADPPYLIMEYVSGPSLRDAITAHGPRFPIASVSAILRGILHALSAAHEKQLIHRDIKPENILLNHKLEELAAISEQAVKVTDFDLGRTTVSTREAMLQSGSVDSADGQRIAGTLAYMSPEQREGQPLDVRSDLYACGIVLFEMLTGERPQGGDVPSQLRRDVPPIFDQLFQRSYTRLDRRFASARDMLDALRPAQSPPPISPPQAWGAPTGGRSCPNCQAGVSRSDQFCIQCGKQLIAAVPHCAACGAFVNADDRFCIFCGKDLRVLAR